MACTVYYNLKLYLLSIFDFSEKMKFDTPPVSPGPGNEDDDNEFNIDDIGEVSKQ